MAQCPTAVLYVARCGDLANAVVAGVCDEEIAHAVDGEAGGSVQGDAAGDAWAGIRDKGGRGAGHDAEARAGGLTKNLVGADGGKNLGVLNGDVEIVAGIEDEAVWARRGRGADPQVPATVVREATPADPLASMRTQLCLLSAM